jgi:putative Ca2+/H+ antiporter (TMEM165/GDT1 family)
MFLTSATGLAFFRWVKIMTAFWISLLIVLIAEMGDKTQLVALAFATRYKASTVLLGVFLATLVVHLLSVALGEVMGLALPVFRIKLLAGLAFIGFGLWTLRGDDLGDEEKLTGSRFGPLLTVATTFFPAELGDKTMLATVTIASEQRAFVPVWLGSTLGMILADGLAIIVGKVMGKSLPERLIKYGAAAVFILSGLYTLWEAPAG